MKKMYGIELCEKYDGKNYPKYFKLNEVYSTLNEAKKACENWKIANPNSNFFPTVRAIMNKEDLNNDLVILLKK